MNSGQKTAVSVLVTVVLFTAFLFTAYSPLFKKIETKFYQPERIAQERNNVKESADYCNAYIQNLLTQTDEFVQADCIQSYFSQTPSENDTQARARLSGDLFVKNPGLDGLRLIDKNGRNLHFSSYGQDIAKQNGASRVYKNYSDIAAIAGESSFELVSVPDAEDLRKAKITFNEAKGFINISQPVVDKFGIFRGTFVFYFKTGNLEKELIKENIISITDSLSLFTSEGGKTGGFVIGLPKIGRELFVEPVNEVWKNKSAGPDKMLEAEENKYWVSLSDYSSQFIFVSEIYTNDFFELPATTRILLCICVFITTFLILFLIFSFKTDDMVVIRSRIKKIQFAFVAEYLENKESVDWDQVSRQIEGRKADLFRDVKQSLGRKGRRHEKQVDLLLNKSWDEILSAIGSKKEYTRNAALNDAATSAEIKRMLEEVLSTSEVRVKAISAPETIKTESAEKVTVARPAPVKTLEPVEELDEVEEIEEIEDAEGLEDVDAVEAVEELTEVEEVEDAEAVEELTEVEEVEDAEAVEELTEVEEVEDAEAVEELTEVEEVEDAEAVEELTEVEEIEDAEAVEELTEVEEVENAEAVEELTEIEEVEEVEELLGEETEVIKTEEVEELLETEDAMQEVTEPAEEVLDEEKTQKETVEELLETEPVIQEDSELVEELTEVESVEDAEEAKEVEEVEDAEVVEELAENEPVSLSENIEEIETVEELDDIDEVLDDSELAEKIEEAEEVAAVSDFMNEAETVVPIIVPDHLIAEPSNVMNAGELETVLSEDVNNEEFFDGLVVAPDFRTAEENLTFSASYGNNTFASVENVFAEELRFGEAYIKNPEYGEIETDININFELTDPDFGSTEELIPVEKDSYFSMAGFGQNNDNIQELESSPETIEEKDGVFSISENLEIPKMDLDRDFKKLVESVLK